MSIGTPDPVDVHVGKRLRAARNLKGISQEKLGMVADLTFQQIQKYEKGLNRISASKLVRFAVLLERPVEWFFEGAPGYTVDAAPTDVAANFFELPYAADVAKDFIAIVHNVDRCVVRDVTHALAGRNGSA